MYNVRIRRFFGWASIAAVAFFPLIANGNDYPTKPIRMIHSAAAGSSGDILGRFLATFVSKSLGQPIYVENIAGTGGIRGMAAGAKAPADGHTLVQINQAQPVAEHLYKKLDYRLLEDFAPITQLATGAYVLTVHPSVPARSIEELIRSAKAKPGELNIGIAGNGSGVHLAAALLQSSAGINITQVPYKGSSPAMQATIAGEIQIIFLGVPSSRPLIRSGKLRALGVTTTKRLGSFPDLPAIAEVLPGYEITLWQGIAAPAGTPRSVINTIEVAYKRALKLPEVTKKYMEADTEIVGSSPEEFAAYLRSQVKIIGEVMRTAGIRPQ